MKPAMQVLRAATLCVALAAAAAAPAFAAGMTGVWNGAAREGTGKTYLFVLTLWSDTEGIVDYKALKCRSLVKAVPNAAGRKLFRETVVEGAFSGACDNGFFELKPLGEQLRWIWTGAPNDPPIATGTLTRIGEAQ